MEEVAEGFDLARQVGFLGGGIERLAEPGPAEELADLGVCQVLGDPAGDSQQRLGASRRRALEAQDPDLRGLVLALDRETELAHVVGQLTQGDVALLTGAGESGPGGEDPLVECHQGLDRAAEPWGETLQKVRRIGDGWGGRVVIG